MLIPVVVTILVNAVQTSGRWDEYNNAIYYWNILKLFADQGQIPPDQLPPPPDISNFPI